MTVSVAPPINTSIANGVTASFPFNFNILQNADLRVTVNGAGRTEGVHYDVELNLDQLAMPGGNVVFRSGQFPAANTVVTRRRLMSFERSTNYVNLGDLLASVLNADQDAPVMMIQQLAALALQLVEDGEGGFVWDAKNNRIINVGSGVDSTDGANIGNVLALIEQYINNGSALGVAPRKWDLLGNGEDSDFVLDGADVDEALLYQVVIDGEVIEPYDGFTIVPGDSATQRVLRLPAELADGIEGFVILDGYARPWSGPPPVFSLALTVRTFAGTAETLDHAAHHSYIVTSNSGAVTETIRENTGAANDWNKGEFFSVRQGGTGQVTVALEGAGTLIVPPGFAARTRGVGAVITAICEDPDTATWTLSGDLERTAADANLTIIQIPDRSALNGTASSTGTTKGSFVMPFDLLLEPVADHGVYAFLAAAQGSGSTFTVDINRNGTSILSTKITIDNAEKSSITAAVAAAYAASGDVLAEGDEITFDIDQIGNGTGAGLTVCLVGRRAS